MEKALERDPRNNEPLYTVPWTYRYLRDGRSADEAYARALKTFPEDFSLGLRRAVSAFELLNDDTAIVRFLDSVPPERDKNGQVSRARLTWLLGNRQFPEARQLLEVRSTVMYPPTQIFARELAYGQFYWLTNQREEMQRRAQAALTAVSVVPDGEKVPARIFRLRWMAAAEAALGKTEVAFGLLRQVEDEMTRERWMDDAANRLEFDDACLAAYLVLARHDEAIEVIERLLAVPSTMTVRQLQTHPMYDQLRSLPRFQKLIEKR